MFNKKHKLLKLILSVWATGLIVLFLYYMTKSLLAAILVALFCLSYGISMDICQKGMENMKEAEAYAVRNKLTRGALCGRSLLYSAKVLLPFYFLYMLPAFIPLPSLYGWAMVQFAFIIFAPFHFQTVGEAYRDITGLKYPFWIAQAVIMILLTVISIIISQTVVKLLY